LLRLWRDAGGKRLLIIGNLLTRNEQNRSARLKRKNARGKKISESVVQEKTRLERLEEKDRGSWG